MRALSASELLDAWEQGLAQPPARRALTLLAAACPDTPADTLTELSVGQRDACLLTLREWTFGPQLAGLATCPGCGERLELSFGVADVRVNSETAAETLSLAVDGYQVRFRLPNSLDLATVAGHEDITAARQALLTQCVLAVHEEDEERPADQLPANVVEAVVDRMAQADPQANVQLDLSCPSCDQRWQAAFDIARFFWNEVDAWAQRVLREVHVLASTYGWREADILALSPWRRQFYLEMIGR
jgi:hypothetical protein